MATPAAFYDKETFQANGFSILGKCSISWYIERGHIRIGFQNNTPCKTWKGEEAITSIASF
jgi:hypothetical protein